MADPKAGPGTSIDFLKNLVDEVNFIGATTGRAELNLPENIEKIEKTGSYYAKHIESIHFYSSVVFVRTK